MKRLNATGRSNGWFEPRRDLVASQVDFIRHWKVIDGDYSNAPNSLATWFVDPVYQGKAGSYYKHKLLSEDYPRTTLL